MLVLSRKLDESLVIQDDIIVTVLAVNGDRVKLGITAPRDIPIFRMEVWQAIQEQNKIAAELSLSDDPAGFEKLRAYLAGEVEKKDEDGSTPKGG
jgi:carbon storage regulator